MRSLEKPNLQEQKGEWWVSGAGGGENGEPVFNGDRVSVLQNFWRGIAVMVVNKVNELKATEPFT